MLTLEELNKLKKKKHFKETMKVRKNTSYTKGLKIITNNPIDIKTTFKFTFNEKRYATLSFPLKIFFTLTKKYSIVKEIINIRKQIIEQAVNSTVKYYDLNDIFYKSYIWFEVSFEKVKLIKVATLTDVLLNPIIQTEILQVCKSLDENTKEERLNSLIEELNKKFNSILENCKSKDFIDGYVSYGDAKVIAAIISKSYDSGLLTEDSEEE